MVSAGETAETGATLAAEWKGSWSDSWLPWPAPLTSEWKDKWNDSFWAWPAGSYITDGDNRWKKVDKYEFPPRPPSAASKAEMEWRKKLDAANDAGFDSVLKHELVRAKITLSAMQAEVYRKKMSLVSRLLSEHLCAVSWVSFDALRISGRNLKRRVRCSE